MKLLFCDNGLPMLLNFRQEIIDYFLSQGHEVVLVYPEHTANEALLSKVSQSCKCYGVNCEPSGFNPLKDIRYFWQLKKIYSIEKPNIAFHYTIKPNIYGTLASKMNGIKAVAMLAGLGVVFAGSSLWQRFGRTLYKFALRKADKVIVLNKRNYNTLSQSKFVDTQKLILFKAGEGVNLKKYSNE